MSNGIVNIHGKDYMTVAARVQEAHKDKAIEDMDTQVVSTTDTHIVVKAIIKIKGVTYTGISSVDSTSAKLIEKQNPYEVAETSAVGRALGFAGYGVIEGIASADEMHKASYGATAPRVSAPAPTEEPPIPTDEDGLTHIPEANGALTCSICGADATDKRGNKNGRPWHGVFCTADSKHVQWLKD